MAFEKFQQFGKKPSAVITITNSQSFGFGGDFIRKYDLQGKKFVELFFDKDSSKIAFKFTDQKMDDNAFKLIKPENTDSKSIVARSFFSILREKIEDFNLERYESRYMPEQVHDPDHGTLYVIQLKIKATN